ncbi:DUF943 family protein [Franconibacter pulveris 1160]|uniref:DUF943 family protein n=1 Tax=Franconibacter pulveris TaxID=435910 RepID=UPI000464B3B2|nr:DUF943 family protein [Franconibacter pulveris]
MKKTVFVLAALIVMGTSLNLYLNRGGVKIIDGHGNKWTASVIVDRLPLSESSKIEWWLQNKESIVAKYHFKPDNPADRLTYYIYSFGDGYQEEENEDRLCFEDMKPPKNCIDKNLLMVVSKTRNGDIEFRFDNVVYIRNKEGQIYQSEEE